MSQPNEGVRGPRVALAIWVGLVLWILTGGWWFYYYSQYVDWFAQFSLKLPCVAITTVDCVAMQSKLPLSSVPVYQPVLFWVGLVFLVLGFFQQHFRRA
jgi:hypothetical protein